MTHPLENSVAMYRGDAEHQRRISEQWRNLAADLAGIEDREERVARFLKTFNVTETSAPAPRR